jgi:hypothetical protein
MSATETLELQLHEMLVKVSTFKVLGDKDVRLLITPGRDGESIKFLLPYNMWYRFGMPNESCASVPLVQGGQIRHVTFGVDDCQVTGKDGELVDAYVLVINLPDKSTQDQAEVIGGRRHFRKQPKQGKKARKPDPQPGADGKTTSGEAPGADGGVDTSSLGSVTGRRALFEPP